MYYPNTTFETRIKFDFGRIMAFEEGFYDIITSSYAEAIKNLPIKGIYKISTEVYRPDLISYKLYGTVIYKMPLMVYNDLVDYKQVVRGLEFKYPEQLSLDELLYTQKKDTV